MRFTDSSAFRQEPHHFLLPRGQNGTPCITLIRLRKRLQVGDEPRQTGGVPVIPAFRHFPDCRDELIWGTVF